MADFIAGMGWYTIPFILVLSVLVFVHELGHFLAARLNGVGVTDFSIGFGPEIFGWRDRRGTRWKFCYVPLGGYVKMVGDVDPASTPDIVHLKGLPKDLKQASLFYKTVWQRIAVSIAGPLANYVFAILIFSALFIGVGQRYTAPIVEDIRPGSAAYLAGIQKGDRFDAIEGQKVTRFEDIQKVVHVNADRPLDFVIIRNDEPMNIIITPQSSMVEDVFGNTHEVGLLGVVGGQSEYLQRPWYTAWWYATVEALTISWNTLSAIGDVIMGTKSADGLGGPLRIAQMSGDVAQSGMIALIWFMALLSVNLGLINLFPVPMLDGGHLLFYFIEAITGKAVPPHAQEWAFRAGFLLIVLLMVWATWNDITQIIG